MVKACASRWHFQRTMIIVIMPYFPPVWALKVAERMVSTHYGEQDTKIIRINDALYFFK